jgi:hypothetical protein
MSTPASGPQKSRVGASPVLRTRAVREVAYDQQQAEGLVLRIERAERSSRHRRSVMAWTCVATLALIVIYLFFG